MPYPTQLEIKYRNPERAHHSRHPSLKNKIWITDGIITKRIFSNEMIPEGWVKGRPYHWQNVRNILYIVKDTQSNQEELITRQDFLKRVGIVSSSVGCPKFQETIKYKNWLITRVSP